MNLRKEKITFGSKANRDAHDLYLEAFPSCERILWAILHILAVRRKSDFTAYYDGDDFCGMAFTADSGDYLYILYLAVNHKIRSKGYGTAILESIKQAYPDKAIVLDVEPLDSDASNYEQRLRRFAFYERNGFQDTGYNMVDPSGTYRILCNTEDVNPEKVSRIVRSVSIGMSMTRIRKA